MDISSFKTTLHTFLLNSDCKVKPTQIPKAIDLVSHNLKYNDVVNMQDVTGLDRIDFSDVLDLGKAEPSIPKPRKGKMGPLTKWIHGKLVNRVFQKKDI